MAEHENLNRAPRLIVGDSLREERAELLDIVRRGHPALEDTTLSPFNKELRIGYTEPDAKKVNDSLKEVFNFDPDVSSVKIVRADVGYCVHVVVGDCSAEDMGRIIKLAVSNVEKLRDGSEISGIGLVIATPGINISIT